MFDGLNLEIPEDSDLLCKRIENWICCVVPANEEQVIATNTSLPGYCALSQSDRDFFTICLIVIRAILQVSLHVNTQKCKETI